MLRWLRAHFPVEHIPSERYQEADFLICGDFGYRHESFRGVKIFTTGENHEPNLCGYDYCLTHEWAENDRCLRFPYWQTVLMRFYGHGLFRTLRRVSRAIRGKKNNNLVN